MLRNFALEFIPQRDLHVPCPRFHPHSAPGPLQRPVRARCAHISCTHTHTHTHTYIPYTHTPHHTYTHTHTLIYHTCTHSHSYTIHPHTTPHIHTHTLINRTPTHHTTHMRVHTHIPSILIYCTHTHTLIYHILTHHTTHTHTHTHPPSTVPPLLCPFAPWGTCRLREEGEGHGDRSGLLRPSEPSSRSWTLAFSWLDSDFSPDPRCSALHF